MPRSRKRVSSLSGTLLAALLVLVMPVGALSLGISAAGELPPHHLVGGFRNPEASYRYSLADQAVRLFRRRPLPAHPGARARTVANDGVELRANGAVPTVTWIGHATLLLQLDGTNILTDPNWSERASPLRFAGPRRVTPPGLRFEDLPPIHAVIISHDHYDHLDLPTIRRLARTDDPLFLVPLGVKAWLADRGVRRAVELDWWASRELRGLRFVCTPAQHSSGRGLHDRNRRLWASWVIAGRAGRVFFGGDTGYYSGFAEIGRRLGPFDVVLLPIGGYSGYATRHPNHLNPEEAVTAFLDLRGERLVPMHWGTFSFNREPFDEPPARLLRAAARAGVGRLMAILDVGQSLDWRDRRFPTLGEQHPEKDDHRGDPQ